MKSFKSFLVFSNAVFMAFLKVMFKPTVRRVAFLAFFALVAGAHYALAQSADSAAGAAAGTGAVGVISALFKSLPSWVGIVAFLASEVIGAIPTQSNGVLTFIINGLKSLFNGFKTKL